MWSCDLLMTFKRCYPYRHVLLFGGWSHLRDHSFPFHHHHRPFTTYRRIPSPRLSLPQLGTDPTKKRGNGETRERGNEGTGEWGTRERGQRHGRCRFGECAHVSVPFPLLTPHLRTTGCTRESTRDATASVPW